MAEPEARINSKPREKGSREMAAEKKADGAR